MCAYIAIVVERPDKTPRAENTMVQIDRSPLSNDDTDEALATIVPMAWMSDALAELEAKAWLLNNQTAARLIGAARLALAEA